MVLAKSGTGQSPEQRTKQHLASLEMQARARIAAAEASRHRRCRRGCIPHANIAMRPVPGIAEALKSYRAAQEQLAAAPEPRKSLTDRLLGRQPPNPALAMLGRAVAVARDDLIAVEHAIVGTKGNLARVEKAESAERVARMGNLETQRRAAWTALTKVVMAQRMVQAYPRFVYCGPPFVSWIGAKVERKRKGPHNPWAVNQRGIPLDFGQDSQRENEAINRPTPAPPSQSKNRLPSSATAWASRFSQALNSPSLSLSLNTRSGQPWPVPQTIPPVT